MNADVLDVLTCPFCGAPGTVLMQVGGEVAPACTRADCLLHDGTEKRFASAQAAVANWNVRYVGTPQSFPMSVITMHAQVGNNESLL